MYDVEKVKKLVDETMYQIGIHLGEILAAGPTLVNELIKAGCSEEEAFEIYLESYVKGVQEVMALAGATKDDIKTYGGNMMDLITGDIE